MKAEKKIYNLIIKTPHFKMFEEVCSYFDLSWKTPWDDAFAKYREDMAVAIGDIRMPMQYGYGQAEAFKMDNWSRDFEIITYPEFEARFLNKNDMKDERFQEHWNKLDETQKQAVLDFFKLSHVPVGAPKEPEKKIWTVEDVINEYRNKGLITEPKNFTQKVSAFKKLISVAHWANDGTGGNFFVVYSKVSNIFPVEYWQYCKPSPFSFQNRDVADKFLSVHGVEDLLKTFFGIEE